MLRDKRVLGYVTLSKADGHRRLAECEAKIYPAIVDADLWLRSEAVKKDRRNQTGRKGKAVSNLFTRLAFCSCGATLTVRTGGRPRAKVKKRRTAREDHHWHVLTCSNAVVGRGCDRTDRFRLREWEPHLLRAVALSPPRALSNVEEEADAMRERVVELDIAIAAKQKTANFLSDRAPTSPTSAIAYEDAERKLNTMRRQRDQLAIELEARKGKKVGNAREALRELIREAVEERDADARERIRSLLPQVVERIEVSEVGINVRLRDGQGMKFAHDGGAVGLISLDTGEGAWREFCYTPAPDTYIVAPHQGGRGEAEEEASAPKLAAADGGLRLRPGATALWRG